jgi:hypothetical protein
MLLSEYGTFGQVKHSFIFKATGTQVRGAAAHELLLLM